ncbi:MAG: hypothetical protein LUF85_12130, partial [Bacteroides sp.]|nr:hypothetical protein [Bacteroides sp.]
CGSWARRCVYSTAPACHRPPPDPYPAAVLCRHPCRCHRSPRYRDPPRDLHLRAAPPSDGLEESKAPFIILEGEYEGTDYPSFYRIDFVERQHEDPTDPLPATDHFLPLIRNYTYTIVVREILGPGYRSLEDAATCKPFNTVSELFRFDDSDAESVQFDGKYFLSVSDETIHYDKEQSTQTFVVKTDSPLGWQIGDISYSGGDGSEDWLHMDKDHGSRGSNGEVNMTADTYNPTVPDPTPREATFTVISGRMEHTVHVTQSHLQGISLEIVDADGEPLTEIRFRSNPRNPDLVPIEDQQETFTVKWSGPSGCKIRTIMLGDRIFPFETSEHNAIYEGRTLGNGEEEYTFTITPTAFTLPETDPAEGNPFLQEGATVTFEVTNGEETLTKSIYIRHECISIVVENPETYSYMGHDNTLTLYSNTSWVLHEAVCELPNLFLIPGTSTDFTTRQGNTGGYNTKTGDKLPYSVQAAAYDSGLEIYGLTRSGRKMSLTFRDTEGIAPDQTLEIVAATPDPNCYLVPGGQTVHIPLRKLFWVWEKEGERATPLSPTGNLNPEAVIAWQTSTDLIAQTTFTHNTGDYRDATLAVRTGNVPYGNALIAIRSGGETLWSFHIWVTDYNPNSGPVFTYPGGATFMDRNIGSNGHYDIDNITPECVGMYYQWGRKDPFAGPKDLIWDHEMHVDSTLQYPLYNAGGSRVSTTYQDIASGTVKNLGNSINHPNYFYTCRYAGTIMDDWYTAQTEMKYQNDYLWNDRQSRKTVFDPCPAGWRVPHYEPMMQLYNEFTVASYRFVNESYPTFTLPTGESIVFPNGGHINDGKLWQAGKWEDAYASLWNNTATGLQAYSQGFGKEILSGTGPRKQGYNVRCVKDTHK